MQERRKRKKHYTNEFFLQNCEKPEMQIFEFCVITFEPIKIFTRNVSKTVTCHLQILRNSLCYILLYNIVKAKLLTSNYLG